MNWSTTVAAPPAPEEKPLSLETQQVLAKYGTQAKVLAEFESAKVTLELAKQKENELRKAVFELEFPNATEGTNRVELGNGWSLKCTYPYRYDISNKDGKAEKAIEEMAKLGERATLIADRLIKWEPAMSIKEYRTVKDSSDPIDKALYGLLEPILTVTPGSPQIEFEPPKGK